MAFHAPVYEFPLAATPRAARRRRRIRRADQETFGQTLTPREREVCDFVAKAWANKEIAVALGLAEQTVKNYLHVAFEKLGVTTRMELMRYWLQHGPSHGAASGPDPDAERRAA